MTLLVPVRPIGAGVVHLTLDRAWDSLRARGPVYRGSLAPVDAACGTSVGAFSGVVRMVDGARVTCVRCRRIAEGRAGVAT